jgi:hypothetical protein
LPLDAAVATSYFGHDFSMSSKSTVFSSHWLCIISANINVFVP